ncbi:uncharacterized protein BDZ83DRAFT_759816 [Colletotrichum acutatum]|uniref:Uncharacterized protein n=1 Tax=Glomerella acutata TaxID=27357 RepID=A0AAD8XLV0_GLOAC|nr:uncharacterized protein BDZ83DRAFT_759816 [Colletotrichum acutatum]KAK1729717.1 hypothetical protein BDZ83DRAFT_759816 [Colletotrichum acutatum]
MTSWMTLILAVNKCRSRVSSQFMKAKMIVDLADGATQTITCLLTVTSGYVTLILNRSYRSLDPAKVGCVVTVHTLQADNTLFTIPLRHVPQVVFTYSAKKANATPLLLQHALLKLERTSGRERQWTTKNEHSSILLAIEPSIKLNSASLLKMPINTLLTKIPCLKKIGEIYKQCTNVPKFSDIGTDTLGAWQCHLVTASASFETKHPPKPQ